MENFLTHTLCSHSTATLPFCSLFLFFLLSLFIFAHARFLFAVRFIFHLSILSRIYALLSLQVVLDSTNAQNFCHFLMINKTNKIPNILKKMNIVYHLKWYGMEKHLFFQYIFNKIHQKKCRIESLEQMKE